MSITTIQGPSRATIKAAKAAATSPHGLINLTRLVQSLKSSMEDEDDNLTILESQKQWENLQYAKILLQELQQGNKQSSNAHNTLLNLSKILETLEIHIKSSSVPHANQHGDTSSPLHTAPLSKSATTVSGFPDQIPVSTSPDISLLVANRENDVIQNGPDSSIPSMSIPPSTTRRRKAPTIQEYLQTRAREDFEEGEVGLLPIKISPPTAIGNNNGPDTREQLLGVKGSRTVIGSAQIHEELGGQLAEMSHRLKLNALHFANSLEDEKGLLEASQDVLEKNLNSTRASKKTLGAVSSKTRGTTCMTLGIVGLVMVLFVWTYMLIRFT